MTSLITSTNTGFFRKLLLLTIGTLYLLILAGGIVRSTGSGMGCPDWPRCFGYWIPPTEVSQLPENYQQIYGVKLKGEVVFNVYKTWVEYANRLLGVLTGLFIFATFLFSTPLFRKDKVIVIACFIDLLLVAFQGWLGSRVVAAELAPWVVTLHTMVAILIVFILLFVWKRVNYDEKSTFEMTKGKTIVSVLIILSLLQIVLGTQVREVMDDVIKNVGYDHREQWIAGLDIKFIIHRSFSIVLLVLQFSLWNILRRHNPTSLSNWLMVVIVSEILVGAIMAYFSVPAFAQPVHLTLAVILVGVQFLIWLGYYPKLVWSQT